MDDSPLKTFEEIKQKVETSFVTLQVYNHNVPTGTFSLGDVSDDEIVFYVLFIHANQLGVRILSINSNNTITFTVSQYLLTPAT